MKNIEVFGNDQTNAMLIKIDDLEIFLEPEEAALLASLMARANKRFTITQAGEPDPPGAPLTKVRPLQAGQF